MKKILVLALILILTLLISGCSGDTKDLSDTNNEPVVVVDNSTIEDGNEQEQSENNVNFNKFVGAPEGAVALIINLPTSEQRLQLNVSEVLKLQETDEKIIFIPKYEHSNIKVYSMDIDGDVGNLNEIYSNPDCDKEFSLELQTLRSEGIPNYKIVINSPNNAEKEYLLISDGKNGNPNIEYIIK